MKKKMKYKSAKSCCTEALIHQNSCVSKLKKPENIQHVRVQCDALLHDRYLDTYLESHKFLTSFTVDTVRFGVDLSYVGR